MGNNHKKEPIRPRLKLVEKFESDLSSEAPFEIGEENITGPAHTDKEDILLRPSGNWDQPGVSGKTDTGQTWSSQGKSQRQRNFTGHGPKNFAPTDEQIYENVCETLMRDHHIDASEVAVKVSSGIVYLSGKVTNRKMKKLSERLIENLPGVRDVKNELFISRGRGELKGPDAASRNDLGIK